MTSELSIDAFSVMISMEEKKGNQALRNFSQKAEKRCPKWPTPARVLHGFCTEDLVVLLQTRLPCPECQPASATTQQQAFRSDGSGQCSLCSSTATNQPMRQVTLSFNSPNKRANFRDDFLVYDHTTGKTPVLIRSLKLSSFRQG